MKKVVGYVVAIAGLVLMALGFETLNFGVEFLKGFDKWYISVSGGVLVLVGVGLSLLDTKRGNSQKENHEEVPIYEGKGKNRKIVGYQRNS